MRKGSISENVDRLPSSSIRCTNPVHPYRLSTLVEILRGLAAYSPERK